MATTFNSVNDYIQLLPEDRVLAIEKLRMLAKKNLPKGFEETMQHNMISYVVPHSIYPKGYHCDPKQALPFISLASQKTHIAIYHMGIYFSETLLNWFITEHKKISTKKLDMGKSCIRYKKTEDIPYDLIKQLFTKITVNDYINQYEKILLKK